MHPPARERLSVGTVGGCSDLSVDAFGTHVQALDQLPQQYEILLEILAAPGGVVAVADATQGEDPYTKAVEAQQVLGQGLRRSDQGITVPSQGVQTRVPDAVVQRRLAQTL
ncbi:hypothetical protein D3C76_1106000 [compost metagenome]